MADVVKREFFFKFNVEWWEEVEKCAFYNGNLAILEMERDRAKFAIHH